MDSFVCLGRCTGALQNTLPPILSYQGTLGVESRADLHLEDVKLVDIDVGLSLHGREEVVLDELLHCHLRGLRHGKRTCLCYRSPAALHLHFCESKPLYNQGLAHGEAMTRALRRYMGSANRVPRLWVHRDKVVQLIPFRGAL